MIAAGVGAWVTCLEIMMTMVTMTVDGTGVAMMMEDTIAEFT